MTGYCLRCRKQREITGAQSVTMKNGRSAVKGKCGTCGSVLYRIGGSKAAPATRKKAAPKRARDLEEPTVSARRRRKTTLRPMRRPRAQHAEPGYFSGWGQVDNTTRIVVLAGFAGFGYLLLRNFKIE